MGEVTVCLTVFFDEPFWVGIFERTENGQLSAARVVFGAEPKDYDVYAYILRNYGRLRFSPAVAAAAAKRVSNPKRMQRDARKQVQNKGIGTASQQALKLQQEQNKQTSKAKSREQKQAEAERMFELKQQKKKEALHGKLGD